jgi:hypothetical protein
MAIFVAAFVGVITTNSAAVIPYQKLVALFLSISLGIISGLFWVLDYRNVMLVECDEMLLKDVEAELSFLTRLSSFKIVEKSDEKRPKIVRYSKVLPAMFLFIILMAASGVYIALQLQPMPRVPAGKAPAQQGAPVGPSMQETAP